MYLKLGPSIEPEEKVWESENEKGKVPAGSGRHADLDPWIVLSCSFSSLYSSSLHSL